MGGGCVGYLGGGDCEVVCECVGMFGDLYGLVCVWGYV